LVLLHPVPTHFDFNQDTCYCGYRDPFDLYVLQNEQNNHHQEIKIKINNNCRNRSSPPHLQEYCRQVPQGSPLLHCHQVPPPKGQ